MLGTILHVWYGTCGIARGNACRTLMPTQKIGMPFIALTVIALSFVLCKKVKGIGLRVRCQDLQVVSATAPAFEQPCFINQSLQVCDGCDSQWHCQHHYYRCSMHLWSAVISALL